jgi:riboflavin biosynthesis pyrimidine reductase
LLLPRPIDDLDDDGATALVLGEHRSPTGDRPWLAVNMVATADGAIAVGGRSGPLGGPADKLVFHTLRAAADVVLVGAATVRAEGYGPARPRPDGSPGPRIAVVTRSGDLDPSARLFSGGDPIVVTCDACPDDRRAALEEVADVVVAGAAVVDPAVAVDALAERGARVVLCEGGPTLNGQLIGAGLVDEWCLTVSPLLTAGDAKRAAVGPAADPPAGLALERVLVDDEGMLLLRYVRA